jgi:hypothetical protein
MIHGSQDARQEEQRAGMSRLKRVLLAALAEHGVELPIPSPTPVPTPKGIPELGTPVGGAPVVTVASALPPGRALCLSAAISIERGLPPFDRCSPQNQFKW